MGRKKVETMKYYVIIIKADSQAINAYDNQDAALSAFHGEMAYAYNAKIETTCIVTDTYGSQVKRERYEIPVEPVQNEM